MNKPAFRTRAADGGGGARRAMAVSLPMTGRNPTGEPGPAPAILQVLPALNVGGVERGTVEIAGAIADAGWRAVVASSGGAMVRDVERAGGEHVALPLDSKNPLTMWRNVGRLHGLIRERNIAIVHARSRAPAWSARYAARRGGARFLTTFHGFYSARTGLKRRYNAVMARGERVIAVSRFVAEHVVEVYGVPRSRLRTVPRGIDPEIFDPARVAEGRGGAAARSVARERRGTGGYAPRSAVPLEGSRDGGGGDGAAGPRRCPLPVRRRRSGKRRLRRGRPQGDRRCGARRARPVRRRLR